MRTQKLVTRPDDQSDRVRFHSNGTIRISRLYKRQQKLHAKDEVIIRKKTTSIVYAGKKRARILNLSNYSARNRFVRSFFSLNWVHKAKSTMKLRTGKRASAYICSLIVLNWYQTDEKKNKFGKCRWNIIRPDAAETIEYFRQSKQKMASKHW